MDSPSTGYVNLTVSDGQGRQPLYAPADSFIMISVMVFETECYHNHLAVYTTDQNNTELVLWRACDYRYPGTYILEASNVTLQWQVSWHGCYDPTCMTLYFSFRPKSKLPLKLNGGLYNCSGDDYWKFRQHLDCNLRVECEDGRDERDQCPFSSPACGGWVALRDKCYTYVTLNLVSGSQQKAYVKHANLCAALNATKGTFTNSDDLKTVISMIDDKMPMSMKVRRVIAVLNFYYGQLSVPNVYRRNLIAYDKTVIHHSLNFFAKFYSEKLCFFIGTLLRGLNSADYEIMASDCSSALYISPAVEYSATCEFSIQGNQRHKVIGSPQVPFTFRSGNTIFSRCPDGHVVHQFLSSSPHYACGHTLPHLWTPTAHTLPHLWTPTAHTLPHLWTPTAQLEDGMDSLRRRDQPLSSTPVFTCRNAITRLSYTLVCDFRHHCEDESDETFCRHPPCATLACSNGQCVSYSKRCDSVSDCLDDSDEMNCKEYTYRVSRFEEIRSPVLITFDGRYPLE